MASFYFLPAVLALCLITAFDGAGGVEKDGDKLKFTNLTAVLVPSTLNKEFDAKGLQPWYDLAKSFIHTVQKDELPYEEIRKIKDSDDFKIEEFLKGWELPFLVVFGIGFLFAIIMPIVGLCFCCCRCCGNCGGEMVQRQSNSNKKKCVIFTIILAIITILMFTGCLMAFVSNDRITDTVKSYEKTPVTAIEELNDYVNQTAHLVTTVLIGDVLQVLEIVLKNVTDFPGHMTKALKQELDDKVLIPLEKVVDLSKNTKKMETLLQSVKNKTKELQERSSKLEQNLTEISNDLDKACAPPSTVCSGINYKGALTQEANFSSLPNVTDQLDNVAEVINENNLEEKAREGLNEYETIDKTIIDESRKELEDVTEVFKGKKNSPDHHDAQKEISKAREDFEGTLKKDVTDKVNDLFLEKSDGWISDIEKYFDDTVEPLDNYRYYAGIGLTCLVLLPVLLMAFGLLCGVFGYDKSAEPTDRGTLSHIGGNCLMAAVGFMFIFVFFLMLFTAFCFLIGGHIEKGCESVRDETLYSNFIDKPEYWDDKYVFGDLLLDDGSINLTAMDILESCRNNDPLFKAIRGSERYNLTAEFNVREKLGDFEKELNGININLDDKNILDNETKKGLRNLGDSGVDEIDFEAFFNETGKDIVKDIGTLKQNVSKIGNETDNSNLTSIAVRLGDIEDEANDMKSLSAELETDVKELQSLGGNISELASETLRISEKAEQDFRSEAQNEVSRTLTEFVKTLVGYAEQTGDHAVKVIEEDLGRCKILTDVYDAAVNLLCRETVYPFNGFWCSIGFCLFFYIPAIIFSVKLAKHYRRMRFEEGFDRRDGLEMTHVNDRNVVYPK